MTIITENPMITTAYKVMYRYGVDILDADDNVIQTSNFDTEVERDRYVSFISGRKEYRPIGADAFQTWEKTMTYQPIPRYQHGVHNKRKARIIYEWAWM